jgi:Fur family ferric uptake transcriptional regulator
MAERARAENDTRRRLNAAGLRATRPRVAVFDALREVAGHHSVEDVIGLLAARGQRVSRMSVYNVVTDLVGAHLVMRADVGPGRALYEVADAWHHHFVCRRCGAVEDVACVAGRKPCLEPPHTLDAAVDEARVIFRGLCARCGLAASAGDDRTDRGSTCNPRGDGQG